MKGWTSHHGCLRWTPSDKCTGQLIEDVEYRHEWTEKVGLGFVVSRVPQLNIVLDEQPAASLLQLEEIATVPLQFNRRAFGC